MHFVVYPIAAVVAWITFFYKFLDLSRGWDNRGKRAVCLALFFPAVAFTIATPPIFAPIDRLIGFPNLAKLLVHGSLVLFSATVQRMLLLWTYPPEEAAPRVRRRGVWAGIVIALMAVLLIAAPVDRPTPDFTQVYATTPWVAEYLLVYLSAVGAGLAEISRLCWRYAQAAGRPWLVRGLRLTAVGAAIGIGYCLTKAVYVIARNFGADWDLIGASSPAFAAVGAILVAIGLTMPAWGERVSGGHDMLARYRSYRALYPLWKAMVDASPGIALVPTSKAKARWSGEDFRLLRREMEILDGRLALREYLDPAVAVLARAHALHAGVIGQPADAIAEAAMLRAGLRARRDGSTARPGLSEASATAEATASGEAHDGTEWLVLVSRAFAHSPAVRAAVAGAAADPAAFRLTP